jgi:hypothetical protein
MIMVCLIVGLANQEPGKHLVILSTLPPEIQLTKIPFTKSL